MVGWRTAGAGRMGKKRREVERDLNQSSSKMECVRRGKEKEKGGDVEEDVGESGKVLLAGKWVEAPLLSPALSTSCTGGAVIGLGTPWRLTAAYPMSPVKRGRIGGRRGEKLWAPSSHWVQARLTGCQPRLPSRLLAARPGPAGWLAGWTSISVGRRVQLDAH